jgi:hypothetical protein
LSTYIYQAGPGIGSNTKEHLLEKIDEENRPHAGLAQEIGFGSAYLCSLPWLVKGAVHLHQKECNKLDLTGAQCFGLAHHNDD